MKKFFIVLISLCLLIGAAGCKQSQSISQENLLPIDETAEAEIRTAISLLLDREYIARQIAQGGQVPASTFVPKGMTDADGTEFYANTDYFDPSQASYEANFTQAMDILRKYLPMTQKPENSRLSPLCSTVTTTPMPTKQ